MSGFSHVVLRASDEGAEGCFSSPLPRASSKPVPNRWPPDEVSRLFMRLRRMLLLRAALDVDWCMFTSGIRLNGAGQLLLRWYSRAASGGAGLWVCGDDERVSAATILLNGYEEAHERDRIYQALANHALALPDDLWPAVAAARRPRAWTVFDRACEPRYELAIECAATLLGLTLFCVLGTVDAGDDDD